MTTDMCLLSFSRLTWNSDQEISWNLLVYYNGCATVRFTHDQFWLGYVWTIWLHVVQNVFKMAHVCMVLLLWFKMCKGQCDRKLCRKSGLSWRSGEYDWIYTRTVIKSIHVQGRFWVEQETMNNINTFVSCGWGGSGLYSLYMVELLLGRDLGVNQPPSKISAAKKARCAEGTYRKLQQWLPKCLQDMAVVVEVWGNVDNRCVDHRCLSAVLSVESLMFAAPVAQLVKPRTSKQNFFCLTQGYIRYNVPL